MGEVDTETLIEAARHAARLRRWIRRCQLGMFGVVLIAVMVFEFWRELNPFVSGVFFWLRVLALGACLAVGNVAWWKLIEFRCPRCGKYFIAAFGLGYLKKACRQCGLVLDPAVIEKTKALEGAEM